MRGAEAGRGSCEAAVIRADAFPILPQITEQKDGCILQGLVHP